MVKINYDKESDSLYVQVSSKPAFLTFEVSEHVGLDLTKSKIPVGVEILQASAVLSKLFGKRIDKEKIKDVLCDFSDEENIYNLNFEYDNQRAVFAIPKVYKSPVLGIG